MASASSNSPALSQRPVLDFADIALHRSVLGALLHRSLPDIAQRRHTTTTAVRHAAPSTTV
eukprot:770017-Rhodomonas_salina.2